MNDSLRQTTGMVLVCSLASCAKWTERPQQVFSSNFDFYSSIFLNPPVLERTMLSFLLGSNTSNALEYILINAENNRFFDCNRRTGCDPFNKISRTFPSTFWGRPLFPFRPVKNFGWMDRAQYFHYFRIIDRLSFCLSFYSCYFEKKWSLAKFFT